MVIFLVISYIPLHKNLPFMSKPPYTQTFSTHSLFSLLSADFPSRNFRFHILSHFSGFLFNFLRFFLWQFCGIWIVAKCEHVIESLNSFVHIFLKSLQAVGRNNTGEAPDPGIDPRLSVTVYPATTFRALCVDTFFFNTLQKQKK